MNAHSPLPWVSNEYGYIHADVQPSVFGSRLTTLVAVIASEADASASLCQAAPPSEAEANAKLIVRAVNAHDTLVSALQKIASDPYTTCHCAEIAQEALKSLKEAKEGAVTDERGGQ